MATKEKLISDLQREGPFDINDVVRWANRLLPHFVPAQNRYKVSDQMTIRIVRYYMSQNLITKPGIYQGRKAMFAPGQVLQILGAVT